MPREVVDAVLRVLAEHEISTVDITGGAPEMNPNFEHLVLFVQTCRLTHECDSVRLGNRLAAFNGQRPIRIGMSAQLRIDERLSLNLLHRLQYSGILDATQLQLPAHHARPISGPAGGAGAFR